MCGLDEVINSPENPTAVDKYLAFIGSKDLSKFVIPRLQEMSDYSGLTEGQWETVEAALIQFYDEKVHGKPCSECYAQSRLDLINNNL